MGIKDNGAKKTALKHMTSTLIRFSNYEILTFLT